MLTPSAHRLLRAWAALLVMLVVATLAGCDEPEVALLPRSQTLAELRIVRKGVTVKPPSEAARAPYPRERLSDGAVVELEERALAWVRRDGGATFLVRGPARLELRADALHLHQGRAFVDTPPEQIARLVTPSGPLSLSHVRASVDVGQEDATSVYVLTGEVRTEGDGRARAGERLRLSGKGAALQVTTEPEIAWEDWTGGLATTDRAAEPAPYGIGTVGARRPGEAGTPRFPLAIQRLDVRVTIHHDFAITEVDQTFFNPSSDTVEGIYRFRTPAGATLHRFGVDRDGGIVFGYVKEKKAASKQYESHVYHGSTEDPALLEWEAPGVYRARLYPIGPGQSRQVIVRYAEWLGRTGKHGERRLYTYPMAAEGAEGSLPLVEEFTARIDLSDAGADEVRVGMDGVRRGQRIYIRKHDLTPRADLSVELLDRGLTKLKAYRSPHVADLDTLPSAEHREAKRRAEGEADYLLVPLRPLDIPDEPAGLDLVIVVDSSAATQKSALSLARTSARALLTHLGPEDRVALFAGDDRLRPVDPGRTGLASLDEAGRRDVLTRLARLERGGASDLGAILSEAAASLDPKRRGAVVYIGDGRPTVGELALSDLRERMDKLPRPVRIFALGVGDDVDLPMLEGLARGAFAQRVDDAHAAARAALALLEAAERPTWLRASVDLGSDVERIYPRDLGAMTADESLVVVGRINTKKAPDAIKITSPQGDEEHPLLVTPLEDEGDLRRRWAEGRLARMLEEDAGHAAMVDLGSQQGIITPVTSLYVPTTNEMTPEDRRRLRLTRQQLAEKQRERTRDSELEREAREEEEADEDGWFDQILRSGDDEAAPATVAPEPLARNDNKEGGTGTRAKGEEGSMGRGRAARSPAAAATAMAEAPPAPSAEPEAPAEDPADTDAPVLQRAPAKAKRYALEGTTESKASADAPKKIAPGSGGNEPDSGVQKLRSPTPKPSATTGSFGDGDPLGGMAIGDQTAEESVVAGKKGRIDRGEEDKNQARDFGGEGEDSDRRNAQGMPLGLDGRLANVNTLPEARYRVEVQLATGSVHRRASVCGAGASVPLVQRIQLWRERLAKTGGQPAAVASVYRRALWLCEASSWRARTRLLSMLLDAIPTVSGRVALWRLMFEDLGAADVLYRGILSRVKTPEDKRELSRALGLRTIDPGLLEKLILDAKTPQELVEALKPLVDQWPDDLDLALRLLEAHEDAGDPSAARELARRLRARPDADARVRTAVGELYLRLSSQAQAPAEKTAYEAEARRAFGEIVEFSPDDPVARRRLGDLLRAHGWYGEASRQYQTLAKLAPDDPSVALLLASAAEGLGKLEEAVKWTEKGGEAGAPDVAQGPAATARAFAATFLVWGKLDAREKADGAALEKLSARHARVLSAGHMKPRAAGQARVTLTWSHPEFHPTLWSNALGSMMPAPEGDVTLGIAQVMVPPRAGARVEVRIEPTEVAWAARLGAKAILTVVFDEGGDDEKILKLPVLFERDGRARLAFSLEGRGVESTPAAQDGVDR